MNSKAPVMLGLGAFGIALAYALTRKAMVKEDIEIVKEYIELEPGKYYYCTYIGGRKTVKAALGDCYPVIYTLDIYYVEEDNWWPPVDPEHDILEPGTPCRIWVQEPCTVYNFRLEI